MGVCVCVCVCEGGGIKVQNQRMYREGQKKDFLGKFQFYLHNKDGREV